MDIARHVPSERNFTAAAFAELPDAQREVMRNELACSVCGFKAFFRKAASSGQAACFGARPHMDGCNMATLASERIVDGPGANEDALQNLGQHIVLDLAFGAAAEVNADADDDLPAGGRGVRRFGGNGDRPNARAHRRLSSILRNLVQIPEFAGSDILIEPPGRGATSAREFFVQFSDLAREHLNEIHGLWGVADNLRFRENAGLYINSGGKEDLSILVPTEIKNEIYRRHGIVTSQQLKGAHVLVIGSARITISKKKLCVAESANHVAILMP